MLNLRLFHECISSLSMIQWTELPSKWCERLWIETHLTILNAHIYLRQCCRWCTLRHNTNYATKMQLCFSLLQVNWLILWLVQKRTCFSPSMFKEDMLCQLSGSDFIWGVTTRIGLHASPVQLLIPSSMRNWTVSLFQLSYWTCSMSLWGCL